ncbi:helix-hairpin-helix domain-containing protein [Kiritimatiella glycovorans]|uniref:Alpha-L-rhamnosidase six-hairpin glycosidase domain-containing protein n=1 Tax=Kiritimatiella glycovorans TaxID=1307763 RepID=A0A0G3ECG4_9BACT|nr:helix-hairpin-helix domain-containing protein [Kiritimatiella glycovorans]AKJ64201.1 hypothetical protein L21SP4_00939 [Kiritimatiella glycovorans]
MLRNIRVLALFMGVGVLAGLGRAEDETFFHMQWVHPDNEMAYYIVDDGEGRWLPSAQGVSMFALGFEHGYTTPGEKARRYRTLSLSGHDSGWIEAPVTVTGTVTRAGNPLKADYRLSPDGTPAGSGEDFYLPLRDAYDKAWIEAGLDRHYALDRVELTADAEGRFPRDFDLEITVDGGEHWNVVPKARFLHFPNPGDATVVVRLNGVVADGVRLVTFHRDPEADGSYALALGAMRVIGDREFRFAADGLTEREQACWNNLWLIFGEAANEIHDYHNPVWPTDRPYSGGMLAIFSSEWALWNAMKMAWIDSKWMPDWIDTIRRYPITDRGYIYLTPTEDRHLGHSRHYAGTAIYVSAVSHYYLMTRDRASLEEKSGVDGLSILEKADRGMGLFLDELGGRSGLVTIDDPELQGLPESRSANYWDGWPFGYQSAYLNAHVYDALIRYADLLEALGGEGRRAKMMRTAAARMKRRFNQTFWNEAKGRYIGWIDARGERIDYGFTFLNLKAVDFGLAPPERAGRIMAWINGDREIADDTSIGRDIYHWNIAPRSTTLSAESTGDKRFKLFHGQAVELGDFNHASWEINAQNGGMILFTSYYDLHARLRVLGFDNAMERMRAILNEAARTELRWMPITPFGVGTPVGAVREFPESGLVPFFFIDGVMGIRPIPEGLSIHPRFPESWGEVTVRDFHFAGRTFDITASHKIAERTIEPCGGQGLCVRVPAGVESRLSNPASRP